MNNLEKPKRTVEEREEEANELLSGLFRSRILEIDLEEAVIAAESVEKEAVQLSEISIDDFLAMPPEERDRVVAGYCTPEQIRELWQRRGELDLSAFQMMIMSTALIFNDEYDDDFYEHEDDPNFSSEKFEEIRKLREICPFTSLKPDTSIASCEFGHTWLGDGEIRVNSSIAEELLNLIQRVEEQRHIDEVAKALNEADPITK